MKYVSVDGILPDNLIREIQKYIQGEYIYIPVMPEKKKKWGENTKSREYLLIRNAEIQSRYISGKGISDLAQEFFLSESSIKKIVYSKNK